MLSAEPRNIRLQKADFSVLRLQQSVFDMKLIIFGLDDSVLRLEQSVFDMKLIIFGLDDGVLRLDDFLQLGLRIDMNFQLRRLLRFTRSRPLQLFPQQPRLLHALNRLRLHIQPKHLHLIPRSISRLAHATALHRAPRTRLLLQPDLRLASPNTVLNLHHWSQAFGHGCCGV
jgi:hypothetical protein